MGQIWPLTAPGLTWPYKCNLCVKYVCFLPPIFPTKVLGEGPSCVTEPMLIARKKRFHDWPAWVICLLTELVESRRPQRWWELAWTEGIVCSGVCAHERMFSASGGVNDCLQRGTQGSARKVMRGSTLSHIGMAMWDQIIKKKKLLGQWFLNLCVYS